MKLKFEKGGKKMNKKKMVTVCLVVALMAVFAIGGSLAYFTDTDAKTNTFTVGNVKIELTETEWDKSTSHIADPGVAVAKNPVVTNKGANEAWVRVNVTISDAAAFKRAMEAHQITDLATIFAGHSESVWKLAGTKADTAADTITYSYYYKNKLAPKASTEALFTSVTIPASFTSAEMAALGNDFTINVTADAIQTSGLDTVEKAFAAFDAN